MKDKGAKYGGCLFFASNALARNMTRLAEEAYAPTGLAPSHAMLLMTIIDSPGINPTDAAEIMQLNPSTVTRFVEKLESKGLVNRQTQGKFTELYATDEGNAMNMRIKAAWMSLYAKYIAIVGEEQACSLASLAFKTAKKLEEA